MKPRLIAWSLAFVEILVLVVLGILIDSQTDDQALVNVYWVISVVLFINRMVMSYDLKSAIEDAKDDLEGRASTQTAAIAQTVDQLGNLGKVLDIRDGRGAADVMAIGRSYTAITHPKLKEVKEAIARDAKNHLEKLQHEARTDILDEPEFYKWLYQEFDEAGRGTRIRILSMDEELEWTDTPEEHEFWRRNILAAERGASIERIFVFAPGRLEEARDNPAIYGHREGSGTGVVGRVVDRQRLEKRAPEAISSAGQGFIIINDEQAIVDVFSPDGFARGYVTFNSAEVANFIRLFEKFEAVAHPLRFETPALEAGHED